MHIKRSPPTPGIMHGTTHTRFGVHLSIFMAFSALNSFAVLSTPAPYTLVGRSP